MSGKWESLGKQLGMYDGELDDIRYEYSNSDDRLKELIRQWLQEGQLHTWNHLVHALKSPNVGESDLGDHLKEKYLPGEI